ncbi:hypothetical protein LWC08_01320 [Desulfobaculum bizertense]|uniref:hypothetical protein n=1 Tax=Desulfobaculum bizertense TaxID=376490 RepID=UPI001F176777|nr:hypothetical protein [Desulfobaculum bizertense]UIJ38227.1 hypothetical protein LWC08_01320 [Desulfobaculum bizertense]
MKKIIGLALLSLLLCACQMKPLVTEVEGNIVVVNSEQYKIADNFHLAAVAKVAKGHHRYKSYIYKDSVFDSWIIVTLMTPDHKMYYYGEGETKGLLEKEKRIEKRTFYWFENLPWNVVNLVDKDFELGEISENAVDIIYYYKLLSEKKGLAVYLLSAVDYDSAFQSSHIEEVRQCFTKMPQDEVTD